ncbi:MAG TPA: hypothetical protein VN441_00330 [Syntrophomonas sp.]|nr:hypothetical protein [Syntrophomonas sp.]
MRLLDADPRSRAITCRNEYAITLWIVAAIWNGMGLIDTKQKSEPEFDLNGEGVAVDE